MPKEVSADIVIVGGGIAGCWLLNRLSQAGYSTLLFEKNRLGGCQTRAAQGMIHGGIKYTLDGALSSASETISGMPEFWRQCIQGESIPNLEDVEVLSDHYYLFSDSSFSSRLTTFLGSKVVKGRVEQLKRKDYPRAFNSKAFTGMLYRLQDFVLDPHSLIHSLIRHHTDRIFKASTMPVLDDNGSIDFLRVVGSQTNQDIKVRAKLYIFSAGAGNEEFLKQTGKVSLKTQCRPLHQVMIKSPTLPPIYAHAFALKSGSLPRITITSHTAEDGSSIWYLGGDLAEAGVGRSEGEQIKFAQKEIQTLLPWIDLENAQWKTFRVDRAEPDIDHGQRPNQPVSILEGNMMFCWPIKLTLTPLLATGVLEKVSTVVKTSSSMPDLRPLQGFSSPMEAEGPWEMFT